MFNWTTPVEVIVGILLLGAIATRYTINQIQKSAYKSRCFFLCCIEITH
ncbi:hypothetical protein P4J24_22730 [Bacillus anthracis]|nr:MULTISPECIES: hypothetical protein [Bacillus cereus group]MEB9684689.1 hypothetical protein [Bacillus anthracis]